MKKPRKENRAMSAPVCVFRIPENLRSAIERRAQQNDRSVSAEIRVLLRESLRMKPQSAPVEAR